MRSHQSNEQVDWLPDVTNQLASFLRCSTHKEQKLNDMSKKTALFHKADDEAP